ncbi:FtsX-like permease family protein [Sulfurospirillum sp. MES]|uniref:ABC transporter permease n=1 Tax=Sulfurospirillum sp. MES TaxID=1565314 RepID=UPI00054328B5|nr:FtsX-like permease family protein [Sulfurospirillum sp. MES]KHG33377.1 MAG: ABC transporter permease [Sulfurospirillum sp. MES]
MLFSFRWLLLEYAVRSLFRRFGKNFFIFFILSFLIFILSSVLMIAESIKSELNATLKTLPDMTLQRFVAGRQTPIPVSRVDALLEIQGVGSVTPRIWGYYYFKPAGVNFSVVGLDAYEEPYSATMARLIKDVDWTQQHSHAMTMIVGEGVKTILRENYYNDFFNFITPEGQTKKVGIAGVFHSDLALEANDLIVLPKQTAYEIFGMNASDATDIVLKVSANVSEIPTIVAKIIEKFPDLRVVTRDDIRVSYQNIFDYKSGFFLALFCVCAFAFFIIVYDKSNALSSEEKKEIGILKALGWDTDTVLQEKFFESFILSLGAFLFGLATALFYVYALQAPLLRAIFTGYSALKPPFALPYTLSSSMIVLLFLLSVPVYIAATLIPAWRTSIVDADEVLR